MRLRREAGSSPGNGFFASEPGVRREPQRPDVTARGWKCARTRRTRRAISNRERPQSGSASVPENPTRTRRIERSVEIGAGHGNWHRQDGGVCGYAGKHAVDREVRDVRGLLVAVAGAKGDP